MKPTFSLVVSPPGRKDRFVEAIGYHNDIDIWSNAGKRFSFGRRRRPYLTTLREKNSFLCAARQIVGIECYATYRTFSIHR